ncbi:MAG TPA: hypothetical protein VMS40_00525, partial [Vicinamibacterales bacterium]|nr:hypothetical protein [Vicinamibacterales bacterium]
MTRIFLIFCGLVVTFAATAADVSDSDFVAAYAKEHRFNGTILIERRGEIQRVTSFGLANFAFSV